MVDLYKSSQLWAYVASMYGRWSLKIAHCSIFESKQTIIHRLRAFSYLACGVEISLSVDGWHFVAQTMEIIEFPMVNDLFLLVIRMATISSELCHYKIAIGEQATVNRPVTQLNTIIYITKHQFSFFEVEKLIDAFNGCAFKERRRSLTLRITIPLDVACSNKSKIDSIKFN